MTRLLHISGSPRKDRSRSDMVARAFIKQSGVTEVEALDLEAINLPDFNGAAIEGRYALIEGHEVSPEMHEVWAQIGKTIEHFLSFDTYVFSVPMWNFGIPYRLKHLIDAATQKDTLFTFDERGLLGLLGGRSMVLVAARGVALGDDFPAAIYDHQVSYMSMWARMVGITEVHHVTVEKTLFGLEADTASREQAKAQAQALAQSL